MEEFDKNTKLKETLHKLLLAETELKNFKKNQNSLGVILMVAPLILVFGILNNMEIDSRYGVETNNGLKYLLVGVCLILVIVGGIMLNNNAKKNNERKEALEKDILTLKTEIINLEN